MKTFKKRGYEPDINNNYLGICRTHYEKDGVEIVGHWEAFSSYGVAALFECYQQCGAPVKHYLKKNVAQPIPHFAITQRGRGAKPSCWVCKYNLLCTSFIIYINIYS